MYFIPQNLSRVNDNIAYDILYKTKRFPTLRY